MADGDLLHSNQSFRRRLEVPGAVPKGNVQGMLGSLRFVRVLHIDGGTVCGRRAQQAELLFAALRPKHGAPQPREPVEGVEDEPQRQLRSVLPRHHLVEVEREREVQDGIDGHELQRREEAVVPFGVVVKGDADFRVLVVKHHLGPEGEGRRTQEAHPLLFRGRFIPRRIQVGIPRKRQGEDRQGTEEGRHLCLHEQRGQQEAERQLRHEKQPDPDQDQDGVGGPRERRNHDQRHHEGYQREPGGVDDQPSEVQDQFAKAENQQRLSHSRLALFDQSSKQLAHGIDRRQRQAEPQEELSSQVERVLIIFRRGERGSERQRSVAVRDLQRVLEGEVVDDLLQREKAREVVPLVARIQPNGHEVDHEVCVRQRRVVHADGVVNPALFELVEDDNRPRPVLQVVHHIVQRRALASVHPMRDLVPQQGVVLHVVHEVGHHRISSRQVDLSEREDVAELPSIGVRVDELLVLFHVESIRYGKADRDELIERGEGKRPREHIVEGVQERGEIANGHVSDQSARTAAAAAAAVIVQGLEPEVAAGEVQVVDVVGDAGLVVAGCDVVAGYLRVLWKSYDQLSVLIGVDHELGIGLRLPDPSPSAIPAQRVPKHPR
eukprot:scaffold3867_cov254-Pinguiococcus_pyrenoidosus.AAC.10